jgi:chemotaxis protein methyltransferase WspC
MAFAFRRCDSAQKQSAHPVRNKEKRISAKHSLANSVPAIPVPVPAASKSASSLPDLDRASRLADSGQLREAAELCEAHLAQQGPTAKSYYLLGLVCDAGGMHERAAECYRKVLYLEPSHVEALFHLALLMDQQGDSNAAERLRERARRAEKVHKAHV